MAFCITTAESLTAIATCFLSIERLAMTKAQQAEYDRLNQDAKRMSRRIASLQHELNIPQRVAEMLFEDHEIHDDDRDAYYRRAKAE